MLRVLIAAGLAASLSSVAAAQGIPVTLSEWKIEMPRDTVRAGQVTFRIKNTGTMVHGFHVEGGNVDKDAPQIPAGQSGTLTVNLKPGTYDIYCPLAENSHKMAGMSRKLVVIGNAAPPKKP
ncbi:MAG: cupredoxin domain-containing protein [Gemmatimonadaceae bacterium]